MNETPNNIDKFHTRIMSSPSDPCPERRDALKEEKISGNNQTEIECYSKNTAFVRVKIEPVESIEIKQESDHVTDNSEFGFNYVKQEPCSVLEPVVIIAEGVIKKEDTDVPLNFCTKERNNSPREQDSKYTEPNTSYHNIKILVEEPLLTEQISCPLCHKLFVNKGNLHRHMPLHDKLNINCEHCDKHFTNKELYEKHKLKHTGERPHQCETCKKTFKTKSNLFQHQRVHLKPYECDLCGRTFATKHNLTKHKRNVQCNKKQVPIQCNVCLKTFPQEWLLRSHERRHVTEKPFQCDICKMYFKAKYAMLRHIQVHNGEKPYGCRFCGKKYSRYGLLRVHLRIHTGEKPYKCPVCDKSFSEKYNMQRHVSGHCKVKHLTCDVCQKKFKKESRLKYHMRTHSGEKPFSCNVCTKSFSHKQNVIRHYQRKHPGQMYHSAETDASFAMRVWNRTVKQPEAIVHSEEILP